MSTRRHLRIAAIGDIHVSKTSQGTFHALFAQISHTADVLLLCGDFTDYGLPEEARVLARELTSSSRSRSSPCSAIMTTRRPRGRDPPDPQRRRCHGARRRSDGSPRRRLRRREGLCWRIRSRRAGPWGEQAIKHFVQEAVDEALKLEAALARLRTNSASRCCTTRRFAAPSKVSRRRSFPISARAASRSRSTAIASAPSFTGTRIADAPEGRTSTGVPVYNVAMPLMARLNPDRPPYLVVELPRWTTQAPSGASRPPVRSSRQSCKTA